VERPLTKRYFAPEKKERRRERGERKRERERERERKREKEKQEDKRQVLEKCRSPKTRAWTHASEIATHATWTVNNMRVESKVPRLASVLVDRLLTFDAAASA